MIYHLACNVKCSDQSTGLGECSQQLTINIQIFTATTFRYAPWRDADGRINHSPFKQIQQKYSGCIGWNFSFSWTKCWQRSNQTELRCQSYTGNTYVTSINMFLLTFPTFCLGLVNSFALFLTSCGPRSYHFSDFSCTARRQPNEVVSESADIPLENFPTYEDCSRPRCPSTWATAVFLVERAHFITTRSLLFAGNRCVVAMLVLSARHR